MVTGPKVRTKDDRTKLPLYQGAEKSQKNAVRIVVCHCGMQGCEFEPRSRQSFFAIALICLAEIVPILNRLCLVNVYFYGILTSEIKALCQY